MVKTCNKCNVTKDISDFYKNKNRKDGHENCCIECYKAKKKIHKIICIQCGKEFATSNKGRKFCTHECSELYSIKHHIKKCEVCGKEFKPKNKKTRFCCVKCRTESSKKKRGIYVCDYCGNNFERLESSVNGKNHIFCSYECKDKANSIFYSGENHPMWDKNKTDEERQNKRLIPGYLEWREEVYKRDNYTCQCCGDNKGHNLNAHHLNSYNAYKEERINIDNGITLCEKCHNKFHHIYGYGNNTKTQFIDFIKDNC